MDLTIRERVAGFDPAAFWQKAPGREQWRSMVAKYEALDAAAKLSEGPRGADYKLALADLASRWPGGLREGELIGPARVAKRLRAASAGLAQPERPRADWPDEAARAVLCWAELHDLIRDQLAFRRALSPGLAPSTEAFAAWTQAAARTPRWPDPARLPAIVGAKLRVRGAYLWLAARSGLDLPSLNGLLLARAGHWDRRPDDPSWAHSP
ncbi:hypothetical protein [Enhygromyxa salina]|uniref:hypothetical protein n=1 Tax=Enhygromyxa salina TaxID=215803 RepID=UPI000D096C8B|nr:hypothetical protein [Enhygromyxa salina]